MPNQKTADIILRMLMPLVFIARKGKRIQKLTKIVKMEEVKKIISPERPDEFQ